MFIPWWGLVLFVALYVYLIATDIRLHRRVEKLEKTVRKLEGLNGEGRSTKHKYEYEDLT